MKTDDLLRKRLLTLAVPEPDPEARKRALDSAILELRAPQSAKPALRHSWYFFSTAPRWALVGAGVVATALLVVCGVAFRAHRPTGKSPLALTAERALLSQMEGLFGSQLDAVVEGPDSAPDIRLAAHPADNTRPSLAQPVLIQFHRPEDGGTIRILSYSGRTVCVTMSGRQICFELLVTGQGQVILSGPMFCWTAGQSDGGFHSYRVTAQLISRS